MTPAIENAWNEFIDLLYKTLGLAPAEPFPNEAPYDDPIDRWLEEERRFLEQLKLRPNLKSNSDPSNIKWADTIIRAAERLLTEIDWFDPTEKQWREGQNALDRGIQDLMGELIPYLNKRELQKYKAMLRKMPDILDRRLLK